MALVVWFRKLEMESNNGKKTCKSACCLQIYTDMSKKAKLLQPTCKHDGKKIHKIPQISLPLSGTSQGRGSSSPQAVHGHGWWVCSAPVSDSQLSNRYFGNPKCSLLHGARVRTITNLSVMGTEGNCLHGTEPHNRRE